MGQGSDASCDLLQRLTRHSLLGRRTNQPTWQVPGSQVAQSAPAYRTQELWFCFFTTVPGNKVGLFCGSPAWRPTRTAQQITINVVACNNQEKQEPAALCAVV